MATSKSGLPFSLSNPFKGSRFFGIFFVVLMGMAALGLAYYLNVLNNQKRYAEYHFRSLDALQHRFTVLVENRKQQALQKEKAIRGLAVDSVYMSPSLHEMLGSLPWEDSFEEFIVVRHDKKGKGQEILYHSFSSNIGKVAFAQDSIYALEKRISFMNEEYRVFANSYRHPRDTLATGEKAEFTHYGLVKQANYDRDNLRLDVWLIIILAMVLILILLGLPFFKLIFISEIERLYRRDVVFTGLSIVVGVPILALIFLSLFHYGNRYYQNIPNALEIQSEKISNRFQDEDSLIVSQLYQLRASLDGMLNTDPIEAGRNYHRLDLGSDKLKTYNNFKVIGKTDKNGEIDKQLISISPLPKRDLTDLGERIYFKRWKAGERQYLDGDSMPYLMQPVISLEEDTEEAIYLVPLEDNNPESDMIASSVSLKSVHNPILAKGYQFAIVDDEGQVWFHSEKERSTLENILTSTLNDNSLKSLLETNATSRLYFDYMGKSMIGFVRPIPGHKLHVISMYDTKLLRLQISEIVSLGSIGILSAILITGFLTLITVFSRQPKVNFYKYTRFPFRFLEPDEYKTKGYLILIVCFLLQLLCSGWVIYSGNKGTALIFLSNLLLMLWAYIFVYYRFNLLTKRKTKEIEDEALEEQVDAGSISRVRVQWQKHSKDVRKSWSGREERLEIKSWIPRIGDVLIICFIVSINIYLEDALNNRYWFLFGIQLLFLIMMVLSLFLANKVDAFLTAILLFFGSKSYTHIYITFLFIWLFLTSVFPSYHYFLEASRIEQEIWNKDAQLGLAKAYEDKTAALNKDLRYDESVKKAIHKKHLTEGYYDVNKALPNITSHAKEPLPDGEKAKPRSTTEKGNVNLKDLLYRIRPVYDETIEANQPLIYNNAFGGKWFWEKPEDTLLLHFSYQLEAQKDVSFELDYSRGRETEPHFFRRSKGSTLFLIIFMALLIGVYALIYFAVNRIFGFHYERYRQKKTMREDCHEQIRQIIGVGKKQANLAIVGFPYSGKLTMMLKILKEDAEKQVVSLSCLSLKEEAGVLQFRLKPEIVSDKGNTVEPLATLNSIFEKDTNTLKDLDGFNTCIVQNFEFGYQNHEVNKLKLDLIKALINSGKHVILLADIYPSQILAFYRRRIQANPDNAQEEQQHFNAWHTVFGSFTDILYGFQHNRQSINEGVKLFEKDHKKQVESTTIRMIENELGFGTYLPTLVGPVLTRTAQLKEYSVSNDNIHIDLSDEYYQATGPQDIKLYEAASDQFILQVQSMAHGYYNNIWNSLATRERFIAYDLARDGFVNTKNGAALYSLMKKGLVVWKNKPMLFNKSFRNFVIASVGKEEAKAMQKVINKNGSWGFAKVVLYMVMLGLVGFLMIGEPQFVSDFQTFVGVLAGLATVVPVITSFVGGKAPG